MSTLTTATTASSAASKTSISSSGPLPINSLYFQESILSDFTRNDLDKGIWVAEEYHVPVDSTHGPHSREALVRNIVSNPLRDPSNASSGTEQGSGDAGLQLWVRSALDESSVSTAELNSVRRDITYGSFRIGMKVPALPGTCSAFFWVSERGARILL